MEELRDRKGNAGHPGRKEKCAMNRGQVFDRISRRIWGDQTGRKGPLAGKFAAIMALAFMMAALPLIQAQAGQREYGSRGKADSQGITSLTMMYAMEKARVWEEPDTSSRPVGWLEEGERIFAVELTGEGWYRVVLDGETGYIWKDFLAVYTTEGDRDEAHRRTHFFNIILIALTAAAILVYAGVQIVKERKSEEGGVGASGKKATAGKGMKGKKLGEEGTAAERAWDDRDLVIVDLDAEAPENDRGAEADRWKPVSAGKKR